MWRFLQPSRIYLDYASATPLTHAVRNAMMPYLRADFGNPSAIHQEGISARKAVEDARALVASTLRVRPSEIHFVGSGTEGNNLAILGRIESLVQQGKAYTDLEVITTRIEHPSILEVFTELERRGVVVNMVNVNQEGAIDRAHLLSLVSPRTVLVSFAYANSEVGTVQDVRGIVRAIKKQLGDESPVAIHIDAAQAPYWLPCALDALGVDLLSLDAGKCGGPKGVGVLVIRKGITLRPQIRGGGQEYGVRSGTENVAGIAGAAVAISEAQKQAASYAHQTSILRDRMIALLHTEIPEIVINGPVPESRTERIANNVAFSIPGIDSEFAVVVLDHYGIAAATKSACGSGDGAGSSVVRQLTGDELRVLSTFRFTLGPETSARDVKRAVSVLAKHVRRMREIV